MDMGSKYKSFNRKFISMFLFVAVFLGWACVANGEIADKDTVEISDPLPFQSANRLPSFKRDMTEPGLSGGVFLVASKKIKDPRFMETVILIIDYSWHGTTGLIINRLSDRRLATVFPDIKGLHKLSDNVYYGGPVGSNQFFLLMRAPKMPETSHQIVEGVYLSAGRDFLDNLKKMADGKNEKFRVYAGYAGWSPGQLENEISRGDWYVMKADSESVFDKDISKIWDELILKSSVLNVKLF